MDNSSIRVVEGAVDETSALLQQKWDKIFYTGSPCFSFSFMVCKFRIGFSIFS
jgi:hypothetical protein